MDSVGPELEFRVDDITSGDPNAVWVIWHLGRIHNLRGSSAYRNNDELDGSIARYYVNARMLKRRR